MRLVLLSVLAVAGATLAVDPPTPRTDAEGFALPPEAVRRIGSARFLTDGLRAARFSPDGKTVYTLGSVYLTADPKVWSNGPYVTAWDAATGRAKWRSDPTIRGEKIAVSSDGKAVWMTVRDQVPPPRGQGTSSKLTRRKLDAATGKELENTAIYGERVEVHDLAPSGMVVYSRYDAKAGDLSMPVVNAAGEEVARWEPEGEYLEAVRIAPDEKTVFLGGSSFSGVGGRVQAVDAKTGKGLWATPTQLVFDLCVSADGKLLAGATAPPRPAYSNDRRNTEVVGWDARTGKELGAANIGGFAPDVFKQNPPGDGRPMAFSPNGKTLWVWNDRQKGVPISVADWKAGEPTDNWAALGWYAPDGKSYLAQPGRNSGLWDASTHTPLAAAPVTVYHHPNTTSTIQLFFDPTGDRLTRHINFGERVTWDFATGKELTRTSWDEARATGRMGRVTQYWHMGEFAVPSPDGKFVVRYVRDEKDRTKSRFEARTTPGDKLLATLTGIPPEGMSEGMVSDDGRWFLLATGFRTVHRWDIAKGGETTPLTTQKGGGYVAPAVLYPHPDGKRVAVLELNTPVLDRKPGAAGWRVGVYDIASGERVNEFDGLGVVRALNWSADGRYLGGAVDFGDRMFKDAGGVVRIDVAKKLVEAANVPATPTTAALSPDGETVALGTHAGIRLYEAATGTLRHEFGGLTRPVDKLAFHPSGRVLVSESADGPLLVWDVRGDLTRGPEPKDWAAPFGELDGTDGELAFAAVRQFASQPNGLAELQGANGRGESTGREDDRPRGGGHPAGGRRRETADRVGGWLGRTARPRRQASGRQVGREVA